MIFLLIIISQPASGRNQASYAPLLHTLPRRYVPRGWTHRDLTLAGTGVDSGRMRQTTAGANGSSSFVCSCLAPTAPSLFCAVVLVLLCSRTDAVQNCSVTVRVQSSANDGEGDESTGSGVFSDLQDALLSLSQGETVSDDCINVLVAEGEYLITDFISISQNLSLQGENNVSIRFNFSGKFDPRTTTLPHYVLSFFNAKHVQLSGLDFIDSPGIITIFNVTSAVVENCSFR